MLKAGIGSLAYRDQWNLFDQYRRVGEPRYRLDGFAQAGACPQGEILRQYFRAPYLFQQEGQYKGYPLRTFVGNNFQGGIQRPPSPYSFTSVNNPTK